MIIKTYNYSNINYESFLRTLMNLSISNSNDRPFVFPRWPTNDLQVLLLPFKIDAHFFLKFSSRSGFSNTVVGCRGGEVKLEEPKYQVHYLNFENCVPFSIAPPSLMHREQWKMYFFDNVWALSTKFDRMMRCKEVNWIKNYQAATEPEALKN